MGKAGKIFHWKHGWIPLDATARAQADKKQGSTADADWLARERARIAAQTPARRAVPRANSSSSSDSPSSSSQSYTGWADEPPPSAPLKDHVEAFFSNFSYMKATDSLPIQAEDYELDDFLDTVAAVGQASDAERPAAAKKLLADADRLGIIPPAELVKRLKALAR